MCICGYVYMSIVCKCNMYVYIYIYTYIFGIHVCVWAPPVCPIRVFPRNLLVDSSPAGRAFESRLAAEEARGDMCCPMKKHSTPLPLK